MTTPVGAPATPPRFNPFSEEFRRNPYPTYARLRTTRPVARTLGMWVLTRYADIRAVLADRTFSSRVIPQLVEKYSAPGGVDTTSIEKLGATSLVFTDDPDHARLRGLVNTVFTRSAVSALRPLVVDVADGLIDRALDVGHLDAITEFAGELPVDVLCAWTALPPSIAEHVARWTHDIRFLLEPGLMGHAASERVAVVVDTFSAALCDVIATRRRQPGDDLVSELVLARTAGGDALTDVEVAHLVIMCFVAGVETTQSLIGNALLAVLTRPAVAETMHHRADLVTDAIRETLRHDSPLQMTKRIATESRTIAGVEIAAGDQVLLCLGSANRDHAAFTNPDEFDLTRPDAPTRAGGHLALGHGMHGCLGGALALLQAEVAVTAFLRRDRRPEIAVEETDLEWQDHSMIIRGLARLPISMRGQW